MTHSLQVPIHRKQISIAVSLAAVSLFTTSPILAQQPGSQQPVAQPQQQDDSASVQQVLVVGTRASQRSSIDLKKYARTAIDSVVAEDVGAFPDKNIGEAISRIAGVALDRGDYGEGVSVNLRGVGPDMTRVEIDGLGVAGAGGGAGLFGPGDRSVEFRELPSDLIKSVDVIKGATAAETEGGLGGSIRIQTRTGLDFKKQFVSARVSATKNTINNKWGPDLNLVYANNFLNGRLGVVTTLNKSRAYNENHRQDLSSNGNNGHDLRWDVDNSLEKTFTFNPSTLSPIDPAVDAKFNANSPFSSTPRDLVTRSAAAKTKADCQAAFPLLTQDQIATIPGNNAARVAGANQRALELQSCLNQWADYTPNNIRSQVRRQDDQRQSADLRVDFKVNNNLTVYGKVTRQKREFTNIFLYQALGNFNVDGTMSSPNYSGPTFTDNLVTMTRTAVPASGFSVFPGYSTTGAGPVSGQLSNIVPGSARVDKNHHVVEATLANGFVDTTNVQDILKTENTYFQLGGTYRNGPFRAEFLAGKVDSSWQKEQRRMGFGYGYGQVNVKMLPNGLWTYSFPAGSTYSQTDPANYARVLKAAAGRAAVAASVNGPAQPAYTVDQLPLMNSGAGFQYNPGLAETSEETLKADMSYNLGESVPFLTGLKFGFNRRVYDNTGWGFGGYTVKPAVGTFGQPGFTPQVVVNGNRLNNGTYVIACTNTAGSLAPGGFACPYGYNAATALGAQRTGTIYMSETDYRNAIAATMTDRTAFFFNGAKNRPEGLLEGFYEVDPYRFARLVGIQNDNLSCMKACVANDGKVYDQPRSAISETVTAGYLVADYAIDRIPFTSRSLPFGVEIDGNWGVRYVRTRVHGTGLFTINSVTKGAGWSPTNPVTQTTFVQKNVTLDKGVTDIMPSFNAATWLVKDALVFRYNWAKMIGRPRIDQLIPQGNCTFDETKFENDPEMDMGCSRLGNPALRPWTSKNQNFSFEWFPNKDTMVSIAHFRHKGGLGGARNVTLSNFPLFAGSSEIDPATGRPLSDLEFTVPTYENGPGLSRRGVEFSLKTAFSFLPSYLRYTGIDLNTSRIKNITTTSTYRDLNSGDALPPENQPKHSYNLSLWYDDGALSARVAWQIVGERFNCIAPCGSNNNGAFNYPALGVSRIALPYAPGLPVYTRETRYIDAKVSYKFKNGVEVFVDGRNIGRQMLQSDNGKYSALDNGQPQLLGLGYPGARYSAGITLRY